MIKILLTSIASVLIACTSFGQATQEGKVIVQKILAPSIQNNKGGEDPLRRVSVYVPPGYSEGTQRYPTIYFLHGAGLNDSLLFAWTGLKELMDKAISSGKIQPMILVLPNSDNRFRGSFYTNSTLTGNWADFIGKDVVAYIDKNFRTIPHRNSRGLSGHSMGGNGALKIGMLFSDVFSSVYAMSPAVLNWSNDFTIKSGGFKRISKSKSEKDILKAFDESGPFDETGFYAGIFSAMGRAYSPDPTIPIIQAKLPVQFVGDSAVYNTTIIKKWEANFPVNMIDDHVDHLKSLIALKIDWGRNEDFAHIPVTAMQFSKKLEAYRVHHFAEEYIGDHVNMLGGFDGRIYTELLPFFNTYLKFESTKTKTN
jgi:S-formylglutathione hydrolase FrmB